MKDTILRSFIRGHFLTGFESTYMPGVGTDVLVGTRHNERFRQDLELVKALGICTIRYPVSWNYVEHECGHYDWLLLDRKMEVLLELELEPVIDLVHHTAIPDGVLPLGFADPDLVERFHAFALSFAERYPWVKRYTVFNEPYLTTQFCGELGIWYPFQRGMHSFVRMALNVARAITVASKSLEHQVPDIQFVHIDTCEWHSALDPLDKESVQRAELMNQRRFLFDDLLLGKLNSEHNLYAYLLEAGAGEEELAWFVENPVRIDIRGLDYYRQSEMKWRIGEDPLWAEQRRGFAAVAMDYVQHLQRPVMLAETNYFGSSDERVQWFKHMLHEYLVLHERVGSTTQVRGFCWFPFISSTDFQHLLLQNKGDRDPVGIYDLDEDRWEQIPTGLVPLLTELAQGTVAALDILP